MMMIDDERTEPDGWRCTILLAFTSAGF